MFGRLKFYYKEEKIKNFVNLDDWRKRIESNI